MLLYREPAKKQLLGKKGGDKKNSLHLEEEVRIRYRNVG